MVVKVWLKIQKDFIMPQHVTSNYPEIKTMKTKKMQKTQYAIGWGFESSGNAQM
jgi:hypothetical protein